MSWIAGEQADLNQALWTLRLEKFSEYKVWQSNSQNYAIFSVFVHTQM